MSMHPRRKALQHIGAMGLGLAALSPARMFAATFMDVAQAQKQLHPAADQFASLALTLNEGLLSQIAKTTEQRIPRGFSPQCWVAMRSEQRIGWVVFDRVVGKYDLIDYAAGFDADGAITGVEILAYRETHGAEIRQTAWRRQFNGRKGPRQIRFADDIRNISGATLSCQHVTEGVQRLSALAAWLQTAT
jgi:Na+-translocating ferredoxin:NAD+ oxidoreductase RnfG subunit